MEKKVKYLKKIEKIIKKIGIENKYIIKKEDRKNDFRKRTELQAIYNLIQNRRMSI